MLEVEYVHYIHNVNIDIEIRDVNIHITARVQIGVRQHQYMLIFHIDTNKISQHKGNNTCEMASLRM